MRDVKNGNLTNGFLVIVIKENVGRDTRLTGIKWYFLIIYVKKQEEKESKTSSLH